jgi:hypothetical protein
MKLTLNHFQHKNIKKVKRLNAGCIFSRDEVQCLADIPVYSLHKLSNRKLKTDFWQSLIPQTNYDNQKAIPNDIPGHTHNIISGPSSLSGPTTTGISPALNTKLPSGFWNL